MVTESVRPVRLMIRRRELLTWIYPISTGPEVVTEAVKVLKVVDEHYSDFDLIFDSRLFGGCAIDAVGEPLPPSTLEACQEADGILMGAQLF